MARLFNVEIKARTARRATMRRILMNEGADHVGCFHQVDTYFNCPNGRLKLRESAQGDELVFYRRDDQPGPKSSDILLERVPDGPAMKALLDAAYGVDVVVDKERDIFFIDNVKFHLDVVEGLGEFAEIEAIDSDGSLGEPYLREQCERYLACLGIEAPDLLSVSYSDLVRARVAHG